MDQNLEIPVTGKNQEQLYLRQRQDYWKQEVVTTFAQIEAGHAPIEVMWELSTRLANMEDQAIKDKHTGILRRQVGMEAIKDIPALEQVHGHQVDVLLLDLDTFRGVNSADSERATGTVITFVQEIKDIAAKNGWTNTQIARMGGEEIVVVIPHAGDDQQLKEKMEIIRQDVQENLAKLANITDIKPDGQTVSIGGIRMSAPADSELVLALIDEALYEAKNSGRNKTIERNEKQLITEKYELVEGTTMGVRKWNREDYGRQDKIVQRANDWTGKIGNRESLMAEVAALMAEADMERIRDPFGALNRYGTEEEMGRIIELERQSGHKLGLVYLDINGFSDINAVYKHRGGDEVLKSIITIGQEGEVMDVGRWLYGGCLVLLVPHADEEKLQKETARVLQAIRERTGIEAGLINPQTNETGEVTVNTGAVVIDDKESVQGALGRVANLTNVGKRREKGIGMVQRQDGSLFQVGGNPPVE